MILRIRAVYLHNRIILPDLIITDMADSNNSQTGVIVKAISGFYYVSCLNRIFECKARGNFRHSEISPIVGDKVSFDIISHNSGVIVEILPRKSALSRPLIANIDKIIIVSAFKNPSPDTYLIDRLTAIAVYNNITPVIVFNKSDTGDFSEFERIYKNAGFNTYIVSALFRDSLNELKNEFQDCICAMCGNSGVGKSSLINALFDGFSLKTAEVSISLGRGKHTTRHTELFENDVGGFVADTPGFSSIEQRDNLYDFKQNLVRCFPDFMPYYGNCAFSDCTHTCEPGCGILDALNSGLIEKTRHLSYTALSGELKSVTGWQSKK
ncbi:MAG: ribosome small subunit-dependent GTPase A [Clostridia bacterium]|nr:ribosome small subunit-dependent GTPase A [Clostridia bacterium]